MSNTTVTDIFLKTSISENDWVTKLHVVTIPVTFIMLVVESSFFYVVYIIEDDN